MLVVGKPKILVERTLGNKEILGKKYPVVGGKIIIKKGGLGKGDKGFTPPLDPACIVDEWHSYSWFSPLWNLLFGQHRKVYYMDGADTLTPITPDGTAPKYTAEFIAKIADVILLEKQAKTTGQTTMIQFFILIGIVLLAFMNWVVWAKLGVINI